MKNFDYIAITQNLKVTVEPKFLSEFSNPEENRFVWAYQVTITNLGAVAVQLLSRYWYITDGNGNVHEVRGPGVVGEQPILKPGNEFTYTSSCPLSTDNGMMMGEYQMVNLDDLTEFSIKIPPFSLHIAGKQQLN